MYLVEDDPLDVLQLSDLIVKHALQDFCCHNQAASIAIKLNVASKDAYIAELQLKVSVFLVAKTLNRRRVDSFRHVASAQCDSVLSNSCFSGRGVRCNHNAFALFKSINCAFLKFVQFEIESHGGLHDQVLEIFHIDIVLDDPLLLVHTF